MSQFEIRAIRAEDEAGVEVQPWALTSSLRRLGVSEWFGRTEALEELEDLGCCIDVDTLSETDDKTIASYLLMARCEKMEDLPDLMLAEADVFEVEDAVA